MKNIIFKKPAIAIVMVFLLPLIIGILIYLLFFWPINTLEANTKIGHHDLSYKEADEAKKYIEEKIKKLENQGLIFIFNEEKIIIPAKVIAFDSEMSYEIFHIKSSESFDKILNTQSKNVFNKFLLDNKNERHTQADYRIHEERFRQTLEKLFFDYTKLARNAYFNLDENNEVIVVEEINGLVLNIEENLNKAEKHLANLDKNSINLSTSLIIPEIRKSDLIGKEDKVKEILEKKDYVLSYKDNNWTIDKEFLIRFFTIDKDSNEIKLDKINIENYLIDYLSPKINRQAKLPSFTVVDNKIKDWQAGESGRELKIQENVEIIFDSLLNDKDKIELKVNENMGEEAEGLAKEIVEIIGTGHSNFSGSPYNRVHNIRLGADIYSGLIIAPDEEFSVLKHLGPVNREAGYLPELVIKNNETVPEYGGGLCQISTTLFRAALQTGLPITARQAHSFRVSYYEPAGTDASIYNPWPDLKFINDTGNHIMLQARIEGTDLYFDFWGTNDGREVHVSDPVIYNIVSPPPTKFIETYDLKPGERKCTENAHNGANTYFDYKVIYPNEEIVEKRFHSYYVPWQEVCLIGKEKEEDLENKAEEIEEDI